MVRRPHAVFSLLLACGLGASIVLAAGKPQPTVKPQSYAALFSQAMTPMMDRFADGISQHYHLDEDQKRLAREQLQQVFHSVFDKHETEINKLLIEFSTIMPTDQTPTAAQVQNWAERAAPIFEDLKAAVQQSSETFHECLNDEQKKQHDTDMTAFHASLPEFDKKLTQWRNGEFKAEEWFLNKIKQDRSVPACDPERSWYFYTREFIRICELDPAQTIAANSILKELLGRAEKMRASRSAELKPIDDQIGRLMAATPPDVEALQKLLDQRQSLMKPIHDLFGELKDRLDKLPSQAQRSKFEQQMKNLANSFNRSASQPASGQPTPAANQPAKK